MELSITRIGNSDGIIFPKALMKRLCLHRSDVLVVDDNASVLTLRKKEKEYKYSGPNTGFFEALSKRGSIDESWGGDKTSEEYLAELRKFLPEKEIGEGLK